jgi:hypothetical protein
MRLPSGDRTGWNRPVPIGSDICTWLPAKDSSLTSPVLLSEVTGIVPLQAVAWGDAVSTAAGEDVAVSSDLPSSPEHARTSARRAGTPANALGFIAQVYR